MSPHDHSSSCYTHEHDEALCVTPLHLEAMAQELQELHENKRRNTPLRVFLCAFLKKHRKPWSPHELYSILEEQNIKVNKSSLYRQLETLEAEGLIESHRLDQEALCFEWRGHHHHHIQCKKCHKLEPFHDDILEARIAELEASLTNFGFSQLKHHIYFAGYCKNC